MVIITISIDYFPKRATAKEEGAAEFVVGEVCYGERSGGKLLLF
jgi:hypothetical protein